MRSLARSLARSFPSLARTGERVSRLCNESRPAPAMQRTLIKSSRSCRRGGEGERIGIPLSLWQSLSQIKVRFGARENNLERARAARIPRAQPAFDFGIFIRRAGFIIPPLPPCATPSFPPFIHRPPARAHAGISRPLCTRTWDNPLESIKGPARGNCDGSFASDARRDYRSLTRRCRRKSACGRSFAA